MLKLWRCPEIATSLSVVELARDGLPRLTGPEASVPGRALAARPSHGDSIWKVGSCDITWYIPYWLVYTTFVISVVISVQSGVIYHEIWKHRRWNITWYITCDEEAHGCYIACYMPRNMVWYILELCL